MVRKYGMAAATVAVLLLTASGCGGDDVKRPSLSSVTSKISQGGDDLLGLGKQNLSDASIKCVAKALEDSKMSNAALKAVIEGDKDFKGSDSDGKALQAASSKVASCITANGLAP